MKPYLAIAVAMMAMTAAAQTPKDVPFFDSGRPDHFIEIDIHAGDGVSTVRQNYGSAIPSVSDFVLTPANRVVMGARAILPIRNYFAVGTAIDFTINNYYWSMTLLERSQGTLSTLYSRNHYNTIDVPLYLQWSFNLGDKVKWRTKTGMYISFGVGGHTKINETTSSTNSLGQSQVAENSYRDKYYDDEDPVVNTFAKTDMGVVIGTGILVNRHWAIDLDMHTGFTQLARNFGVLDISGRTLNVTFTVGYQF
ncbi:MAG: outer membrane beta-barrel protein [Muribaculaceae bacterium]